MTPVSTIHKRLRVSLLLASLLLPLSVAAQVTCTNENTAIPGNCSPLLAGSDRIPYNLNT